MRFYDVTSWSYVNLDDPLSVLPCSIVPSSPILLAIKLSQLYSVRTAWASSFVRPHVIKFSTYDISHVINSPSLVSP